MDGRPAERLRGFLRELKPEARALLLAELERTTLRGEEFPAAAMIMDELRRTVRGASRQIKRIGNPSRLVFVPLEPFLVDHTPELLHRGRIPRSCLAPLWEWICRELIPGEARAFSEQVSHALVTGDKVTSHRVVRAFQDRFIERTHKMLAAEADGDKACRKIIARLTIPHARHLLREVTGVLKARDALATLGSRLPPQIKNLADDQLHNVKTVLDSPIGRHPEIFPYALLYVMSRLAHPWQLVRLAIKAADSDLISRIAETPYALAVELVLEDIERRIAVLRFEFAERRVENVLPRLKDLHEAIRGLRTEMDLSADTPWSRRLAALRSDISQMLSAQLDTLPSRLRRLLRPRSRQEIAPGSLIDPQEVEAIEKQVKLFITCRAYASELAINELTKRVSSELHHCLDTGTSALLDSVRLAGDADKKFRLSQVEAAVRFCAEVFGAEYASLLAKAAEVAAGERKAARA